MPVNLGNLQLALLHVPGDAQVDLAADGRDLMIRKARIAKWVGYCYWCHNSQNTHRFIESLREQYGDDVSTSVTRCNGLDTAERIGWPLLARQIVRAIDQADLLLGAPLASAMRNPRPVEVKLQLARELRKSLDSGYLNRVILKGDPACANAMAELPFLRLACTFNAVMEDLRYRFPALSDVQPPNLSQGDCRREDPTLLGTYQVNSAVLAFSSLSDTQHEATNAWSRRTSHCSPRAPGLQGTILHEYAHHLSSPSISDRPRWTFRLSEMLREQGLIGTGSEVYGAQPGSETFADIARKLGLGSYASHSLSEFAAEALGWRMTPGYAESSDLPRMPRCLETWVHESFPFTRDGPIPTRCVEVGL